MGNSKITDIFGERVFDDAKMRERLAPGVYAELKRTVSEGAELSPSVAAAVADAMKDWAIEHGATHYSHWFQPLSGFTAEKHDSFIGKVVNGKAIMEFSGSALIKGEPDASSFPSGGLRAIFEARGYTAWDCTSPAFLKDEAIGTILCIPTAFYSYNGEALDKKAPLLRSMESLSKAAVRLLRLLGNTTSQEVIPMVGAEQEYFLIDKAKFTQRKDLVYTGRTLFGTMPAKDQEAADAYFASIRERVGAFMKDVNDELWRLGVPAKTQHNEAAPSQHELASIFDTVNITADQNQMVMDTLKKVADRHGLVCLLHEKPFAGINGSGKHNNWSLKTDDGIYLLDQGSAPHDNLQFLLVLSCILKAVDRHADLLRLSAACVGNDYRLGAQEAPPAIISVYLGSQLTHILDQFIEEGSATADASTRATLHTGVSFLPDFMTDGADRNRTSPFAFIGNRFEFRMVGSSDSIADANTVINAIVAEAFNEASDYIEAASDREAAVRELIRRNAAEHRRIIFNGDGYSAEWIDEAARRGLPNLATAVDAIPALLTDDTIQMFERLGVLTRSELEARAEIRYESYSKQLHIESHAMLNIASKKIIPAVITYTRELAETINQLKAVSPMMDTTVQEELLARISAYLTEAWDRSQELAMLVAAADEAETAPEKARLFEFSVRPKMDEFRQPLDALEKLVDKRLWPFPSYGDILYEV